MTAQDTKKAAVLKLLRRGEASISEVSRLAGESRQLVRYWSIAAGIDVDGARLERLNRIWKTVCPK